MPSLDPRRLFPGSDRGLTSGSGGARWSRLSPTRRRHRSCAGPAPFHKQYLGLNVPEVGIARETSAAGRFVVTGTSGTGKTQLIEHLQARGYDCYAEPVRKVLQQELAANGPALPSKDPALFLREIIRRAVRDLADAASRTGPSFFDRGLPDAIAYAVRFRVDPEEFRAAAARHRYANEVFVLPPWKEIFVNDELRGASFDDYQRFHEQITRAYQDCGYTLVEVPRDTVERRADFIRTTLATFDGGDGAGV